MHGDIDTRRDPGSTIGTILLILFGPILWALHFGFVYFVQSMLCAHDVATSTIAPVILVATIAFLAPIAAAIAAPEMVRRVLNAGGWSEDERAFQRRVTVLLSLLSGFGVAWTGLTAFILPACRGAMQGAFAGSELSWVAFVG